MTENMYEPNSYWLDENDLIVRVSNGWDQFAVNNDGREATSQHIIGKPLNDFIHGAKTRHWMQTVLALTRLRDDAIEKKYRCDSLTEKRFMKMEITPGPNGALRVTHTILQVEPLPAAMAFESVLFSHKAYLSRCSNCLRLRIGETWLEPDEAQYAETMTFDRPLPVIYDVCSSCRIEPDKITTYF